MQHLEYGLALVRQTFHFAYRNHDVNADLDAMNVLPLNRGWDHGRSHCMAAYMMAGKYVDWETP